MVSHIIPTGSPYKYLNSSQRLLGPDRNSSENPRPTDTHDWGSDIFSVTTQQPKQ